MLYCKDGGDCCDQWGSQAEDCNYWCIYEEDERSGYCEAKYEPGGPTINLEPIDPVTATLKENSIAHFAKELGFGCDVSGTAIDAIKFAEKSAKFAANLAKGLGIMGTLLGALGSKLGPTPADIIKAVNEALATLTLEINDQFANMEEYVDQSIRTAQQAAMNQINNYFGTMFANCLNEVEEERYLDCLHEVQINIAGIIGTFIPYRTEMDDLSWSATAEDIKKMEMQFLPFMDYGMLRTVNVLTMIATYINDTSDAGKAETCRFLGDLKTESKLFLDYTNFLYGTIENGHQHNTEFLEQNEICDYGLDCSEHHSGMFKQWVSTVCNCRFKFSRMLVDSSDYQCKQKAQVRRDNDCPYNSANTHCSLLRKTDCGNCDNGLGAMAYKAYQNVGETFKKYTGDVIKSVQNYWKPQTIARTTVWEQLGNEANEFMYDRQCDKIEFSKIRNVSFKELEELEKMKQELSKRRSKSPHSRSQKKRNSEEL